MKRDMGLVRELLLVIELHETGDLNKSMFGVGAHNEVKIVEHLKLMEEAGLLVVTFYDLLSGPALVNVKSITWEGYEFLETIRDPKIWKKTKITANEVGSFGIDIIKEISKGFIKTKLKHHTGFEISS